MYFDQYYCKCSLFWSACSFPVPSPLGYHKIPKISPSMYKLPKQVNAKNLPLNRLSKYKPPGGLYLENCPQIQRKTNKNGKFTSNYTDFETQISLRR